MCFQDLDGLFWIFLAFHLDFPRLCFYEKRRLASYENIDLLPQEARLRFSEENCSSSVLLKKRNSCFHKKHIFVSRAVLLKKEKKCVCFHKKHRFVSARCTRGK